jgi:quinol monooxygenase YgiN
VADTSGEAVSELLGIARCKFKEGKREEYKRLSDQAMEIVRTKDSGTLQYDTYFNDDQSECIVIERYRDSEAAIEHAANLADVSAAVLGPSPYPQMVLLRDAPSGRIGSPGPPEDYRPDVTRITAVM